MVTLTINSTNSQKTTAHFGDTVPVRLPAQRWHMTTESGEGSHKKFTR